MRIVRAIIGSTFHKVRSIYYAERLKMPSKMLYFPDQDYWVLKPRDSQLWYKTVNDLVDKWCGDHPATGTN
jgi:hypothetical protein